MRETIEYDRNVSALRYEFGAQRHHDRYNLASITSARNLYKDPEIYESDSIYDASLVLCDGVKAVLIRDVFSEAVQAVEAVAPSSPEEYARLYDRVDALYKQFGNHKFVLPEGAPPLERALYDVDVQVSGVMQNFGDGHAARRVFQSRAGAVYKDKGSREFHADSNAITVIVSIDGVGPECIVDRLSYRQAQGLTASGIDRGYSKLTAPLGSMFVFKGDAAREGVMRRWYVKSLLHRSGEAEYRCALGYAYSDPAADEVIYY